MYDFFAWQLAFNYKLRAFQIFNYLVFSLSYFQFLFLGYQHLFSMDHRCVAHLCSNNSIEPWLIIYMQRIMNEFCYRGKILNCF